MESVSQDLKALQKEMQDLHSREFFSQEEAFEGFPLVASRNFLFEVTADQARVHEGADSQTPVFTTLPKGTSLQILDRVDDWYAVTLSDSLTGRRSGWVSAISGTIVPQAYTGYVTSRQQEFSGNQSAGADFDSWLIRKVIQKIRAMRKKYENNPFVIVSGFGVEASIPPIPPSVNVSFSFRQDQKRQEKASIE